jgi:hypothetical protein
MKKLLIIFLLSLGLIGSANASELYNCEHYWVSIGILGDKSNYNPKDFKLKVERKKATIIQYGKKNEIFKIEKKFDGSSFTAMQKPTAFEMDVLAFNGGSHTFSRAYAGPIGSTAYYGQCTLLF